MDPRLARFDRAMKHLAAAREEFDALRREDPADVSLAALTMVLMAVEGRARAGQFRELLDDAARMARAGLRSLSETN